MSSSPVRPVASAASNIEPGIGEAAVRQRPDEALVAARRAGREVVDRLEDRADRPGRGDLGDRAPTARRGGRSAMGPRGARRRRRSRRSGRGACPSTGPRRPGGRAPRGRGAPPGPALMPAENETVWAAPRPVSPSRQAASSRRTIAWACSTSVSGMHEGELVAADAERAVARGGRTSRWSWRPGGGRGRRGVAARVVDPLEVVEVDDRERHRPAGPRRHRPLPLDLLLEGPVVAEAGQRVAQRLGAGAVVGVLEDAGASARDAPRARARGAPARPSGRRARRPGSRIATVGTTSDVPDPGAESVDERRRDHDRDREHRDEREEQAETDESQVRRLAEDALGGALVVDRYGSLGKGGGRRTVIALRRSPTNGHRGTPVRRTNGSVAGRRPGVPGRRC